MGKGAVIDVHIRMTEKEDGYSGTITIKAGTTTIGPEDIDGFFLLSKKGESPVPSSPIIIGHPNEIKDAFARAWWFMKSNDDPYVLSLELIAKAIVKAVEDIQPHDDKGETTH